MRTETKLFTILFVFALALGTIYWFVTYEAVGAVLLWALALMPLIVMLYGVYHGAMRDRRPEDQPDAEPAASVGETLGPFPSATVWPVFMVLGIVTAGASLIYGLILLAPGVALIAWSIIGLMRESRG